MIPSEKGRLISFLLDAIEKAIYPAMIKRSWIESFIKPVIDNFFDEGTCYIGDEER